MGCSDCCKERKSVRVVGDGEKAPLCCTDVLFAVLFVANLVPLCYLAVSFSEDIEVYQKDLKLLQLLNSTYAHLSTSELADDVHLALRASGYGGLGALSLVGVWVVLCRLMPTLLIIFAQLLLILACVGGAICVLGFYEEVDLDQTVAYLLGAALLLVAVLIVVYLCCIRKRISFTALILSSVAKVREDIVSRPPVSCPA